MISFELKYAIWDDFLLGLGLFSNTLLALKDFEYDGGWRGEHCGILFLDTFKVCFEWALVWLFVGSESEIAFEFGQRLILLQIGLVDNLRWGTFEARFSLFFPNIEETLCWGIDKAYSLSLLTKTTSDLENLGRGSKIFVW